VLPIRTPLLREHPEDVPALAHYFLAQVDPELSLAADACEALAGRDWPGNVRELRNVILQAVAKGGGPVITKACLEQCIQPQAPEAAPDEQRRWHLEQYVDALSWSGDNPLRDALSELQSLIIARALRECQGNQTRAAARLGVHRNALHRMMEEAGLKSNSHTEKKDDD